MGDHDEEEETEPPDRQRNEIRYTEALTSRATESVFC